MPTSVVDQIIEWKSRRGHPRLGLELTHEIERLRREWTAGKKSAEAFSDFIPMRIATIIEVFIREIVRELVDSGSPYVERAEKLAKGARIDFLFAMNLHGQKLSIGDLVAHSLSVSSMDQIISTFEELIPDFKKGLAKSHERWTDDTAEWPLAPIVKDFGTMAAHMTQVLKVRHILTHEIPSSKPYRMDELDGFLDAAWEFMSATDWLVVERLKGSVPRTQLAMNLSASEMLDEDMKRLEEIYRKVTKKGDVERSALRDNQTKWQAYAESEATLHASLVKGGSMHPMIWASTKSNVVKQRIRDLQWWLDREEGDV